MRLQFVGAWIAVASLMLVVSSAYVFTKKEVQRPEPTATFLGEVEGCRLYDAQTRSGHVRFAKCNVEGASYYREVASTRVYPSPGSAGASGASTSTNGAASPTYQACLPPSGILGPDVCVDLQSNTGKGTPK